MTHIFKTIFLFSITLFFGVFALVSFSALTVHGQEVSENLGKIYEPPANFAINAYRQYKDIYINISVPTVIEVPFDGEFLERFDFAVVNKESNTFEPYFFVKEVVTDQIPISITTDKTSREVIKMTDNNLRTFENFELPADARGMVRINVTSERPIVSSLLTLLLDNHVALPTSIQILAEVNGEATIVVAKTKMNSQSIRFPKTTSSKWTMYLTYAQPLRISELRLSQENATKTKTQGIRFLAQPDSSYRVYFNPDRRVIQKVGESGNLASNKDVLILQDDISHVNLTYAMADVDNDGIPDIVDNCVVVKNSDQEDVDGNRRGDVCDDFDRDGLINSKDNCPNQPNRNQLDTDSDGIGDVCDDQESRITERYKWIPWVGVGFAAVVLIVLFVITAKSMPKKREDEEPNNEDRENKDADNSDDTQQEVP